MRNKRRARYYRHAQRNAAKLNFAPVIVILCLSVGCGYAAAKYVVDPVVNYVPELTAEEEQAGTEAISEPEETQEKDAGETDSPAIVEDEVNVEEAGEITGYALQFGCYSGKAAAESAMTAVGIDGLQVIQQDDMYKIVGEIYKTKAEAKAALEKLPADAGAFVTTIYQ